MPEQAPLRVGYVLKRFPRLSETFVLNEILALERQGIEVEIFSLLKPPAEPRHALVSELRAPVTYLPSVSNLGRIRMLEGPEATPTSFADLVGPQATAFGPLYPAKSAEDVATLHLKAAALAVLAGQRGIDHLHAHFASDATTIALLAGRLSGLGYSFTAHARDIFHTYQDPAADDAMRRIKLAEARFCTTVSDYNVRRLKRIAPGARVLRLYNGIDLSRFRPDPGRRQRDLVVAVGRLIEKKGFADLIEACRILAPVRPDLRCRIIGEGPLRDALQAQIDAADLQDRVEILGSRTQEELIGLMQRASVVTLPCVVSESGDRDGLPTVLLEGMALGLPVVTTTTSGGPEIVRDGTTGLLCRPGDAADLARSLNAVLADPDWALRLGIAGRRRAEQLFSLERNVAVLAGHFREVAGLGLRETA